MKRYCQILEIAPARILEKMQGAPLYGELTEPSRARFLNHTNPRANDHNWYLNKWRELDPSNPEDLLTIVKLRILTAAGVDIS